MLPAILGQWRISRAITSGRLCQRQAYTNANDYHNGGFSVPEVDPSGADGLAFSTGFSPPDLFGFWLIGEAGSIAGEGVGAGRDRPG
jgi:hypothetical protein